MIINHNLSAINAHRNMTQNIWALDHQSQKLSSGLRVNRAGDDAAGLAVSEKMRAQIRGLNQASRNIQDGVSMVQTTEGWLQETHSILQRMGELSVQAANGTYTSTDRNMIQVEMDHLIDEINRIASHAEFNTMTLFDGRFAATGTATAAPPAPTDGAETAPPAPTATESGNGVWIHMGANMDHREMFFISKIDSETLGLTPAQGVTGESLSVKSADEANQAIASVQNAIVMISEQRADLGAFQNRLEHATQGVNIAAENLQAAESRIRDADMAREMIDYVRAEILTTSAASMLAQANITPQLVLRILR